MPTIKVEQPFSVRMGDGRTIPMARGVHELDSDVLEHWFVQACLKEGRAVLLGMDAAPPAQGEPQGAPPASSAPITEEQLLAMTNKTLAKLAQGRGITLPGGANKQQMVDAILAHDAATAGTTKGGEA